MTRTHIAAGLLIVGLGLLAVAGFVWVDNDLAHYGQSTYVITGPEGSELEPESTVPENATVIAYSDMPRKAQAAFDKAHQGEGMVLWQKDDQRAVEAISSGKYVEYQGEYYQIVILVGHRSQRYWVQGLVKFIAAGGIGLVLIGYSIRTLRQTE